MAQLVKAEGLIFGYLRGKGSSLSCGRTKRWLLTGGCMGCYRNVKCGADLEKFLLIVFFWGSLLTCKTTVQLERNTNIPEYPVLISI